MFRIAFLTIGLALTGAAQSGSDKAPPDVDAALRVRVQQFYQAHVDRKFRKADEVVAEESKDAFYDAAKPVMRAFEVKKIDYSEAFQKAEVVVMIDGDFVIPNHGTYPWKRNVPSKWKMIEGTWYMYMDTSVVNTPLGPVRTSPPPPGAGPVSLAPPAGDPASVDLSRILSADKTEVRLNRETRSQEVALTTVMGAPMTLVVEAPSIPGLSVSLDRNEIKTQERAQLTIRWEGPGKMPASPATVIVKLKQLPVSVPIRVLFDQK